MSCTGKSGKYSRDGDQRENRGQGGHQDRSQPLSTAFDERFVHLHAIAAKPVDLIEENDGIVHDNSTIIPIEVMTDIGVLVIHSIGTTPTTDRGIDSRITSG